VDVGRAAAAVAATRTTSPLLPVLASLDACRRQMALAGDGLLAAAIALAEGARRRLRAIPGIEVLDAAAVGLAASRVDPTRLVVDVRRLGLTGTAAERLLRRSGVAPEMGDLVGVVCLVTIGDTPSSIDRLVAAFAALAAEARPAGPPADLACLRSAGEAIAPGHQAMTPRDAFFAPFRAVALGSAVGAVAAEMVVPYPPGIPVLLPGEVVTAAKLDYLTNCRGEGMHVRGPADSALRTLRVVA
nr:lysine decarboxylase [Chloroflexia bacterium]